MKQIPRPARQILPRSVGYFYYTPVFIIGVSWILVSTPLRIVIAIQLGWNDTSALYKASTILFACWPHTPVPAAVFIASRIVDNSVRSIDVAYTAISIASTTIIWLLWPLVIYLTSIIPYLAWLRTFDDDWPASSTSWRYILTFGVLDRAIFQPFRAMDAPSFGPNDR